MRKKQQHGGSVTPDDDSSFRGSSVMRAGSVVDREGLIDELEFRLMRCSAASVGLGPGVRSGGFLAAGEQAHRIARNETRAFWNEHRLSLASRENLTGLVEGLFARQPRYLAWSLVPLLGELIPEAMTEQVVEAIVDWLTTGEPVDRVVRDAVTVTLLAKWLGTSTDGRAIARLVELCESTVPDQIRMGAIGIGAYVRPPTVLSPKEIERAFTACFRVATRVDVETAVAVGWAIRELIERDRELLMVQFERHVQLLSRQVFRTAVERLPQDIRARLTARWLAGRRTRIQKRSTIPQSAVNSRKIPR